MLWHKANFVEMFLEHDKTKTQLKLNIPTVWRDAQSDLSLHWMANHFDGIAKPGTYIYYTFKIELSIVLALNP